MKTACVFALIFGAASLCFGAAEIKTVSMTDVNRIVCAEEVKDVFFSEEKGLLTRISGRSLFVKFPVTITVNPETQEKITSYPVTSAELFLVCGERTHSLVLKPEKIPARTIILEPEEERAAIPEEYRGKDEEEILSSVMKAAIEERLPGAFKKTEKNIIRKVQRGAATLKVVYARKYSAPGYDVKEFHLFSPETVTLLPAEAAGFAGVRRPAAAALTAETFKGWARAFVIERTEK